MYRKMRLESNKVRIRIRIPYAKGNDGRDDEGNGE